MVSAWGRRLPIIWVSWGGCRSGPNLCKVGRRPRGGAEDQSISRAKG